MYKGLLTWANVLYQTLISMLTTYIQQKVMLLFCSLIALYSIDFDILVGGHNLNE